MKKRQKVEPVKVKSVKVKSVKLRRARIVKNELPVLKPCLYEPEDP